MSAIAAQHLPQVREQYEDYPYPMRNPEDDRTRLIEKHGAELAHINFHAFEGRARFDQGFRVLDAGGGTGDVTIFLAEQLRDLGGEVVYVDFSKASRAIAEKRAQIRGLTNITFLHDSLLNVPNLGLAPFDFIASHGVLHHLQDPDAGLAALTRVLKPTGALSIMVYGTYGRLSIYPLQKALQLLAPPSLPAEQRIAITKKLLANLPRDNWFEHSPWFMHELKEFGDIGIYDLLLHAQDRAYTVPEVYEWMEGNGLNIQHFMMELGKDSRLFNPRFYFQEPELIARLEALPERERLAAMEALVGMMNKHHVYATPTPRTKPTIADLDMIPFLNGTIFTAGDYTAMANAVATTPGHVLAMDNQKTMASLRHSSPNLPLFLTHFDGKRSTRDIFARMRRESPALTDEALITEFTPLFEQMNGFDWLFLRAPDSPFIDHAAVRARMAGK